MSILERRDVNAVCYLTLNRPEALNALSDGLLAALADSLDDLAQDRTIRCVVLAGAGKAFCAGHDLREMQAGRHADDGGAAYFGDLFTRCSSVMAQIQAPPQPVIAQVHGIATAAGCQLVATCDMAVAAEETKFGVNGVNIGLFCSTPMVALSRNIGRKKAFEMLTTGQFINAARACELGLLNKVVAPADLAQTSADLANLVASKLGSAVAIGKRGYYEQAELPVAQAYAHTRDIMVTNMLNKDTDEGITAFIEKRTPTWDQ